MHQAATGNCPALELDETDMAPSTATTQAITAHASYNHPIQRISHRTKPLPLTIQPPDPSWPAQFQALRAALQAALPSATAVHHAGSTAVPNLPAKAVLDIDLVVPDPDDEASYVAALVGSGWDEASGSSSGVGQGGVPGLRFLFREPGWHGHRFMVREEDAERGVMAANVHVFGPGCPEVERHRIFREWLCEVSF